MPNYLTTFANIHAARRKERTWQDRAAYLERVAEQRASEERRKDALAIDAYLGYLETLDNDR